MTYNPHGLKRHVRNLGKLLPPSAFDADDFAHASGQAVCDRCGLELFDHPTVDDGTLHIRCDGKLVKT